MELFGFFLAGDDEGDSPALLPRGLLFGVAVGADVLRGVLGSEPLRPPADMVLVPTVGTLARRPEAALTVCAFAAEALGIGGSGSGDVGRTGRERSPL